MKRCPTCRTEYPDDANWCRLDGAKLELAPGALTMGWDVPAVPTTFTGTPPPGPQPPSPKPGALTMGWDAQPDVSAEATNPSMLAPSVPSPPSSQPVNAAATARMPQQPGALTRGWDAQPEPPASGPQLPHKPGALTMGWDAQPDPAQPPSGPHMPQNPGALTMGWDVQPEPAPAAPISPAALAAQSVATTHTPASAPAAKSPAATLLGMQAPWTPPRTAPVQAPAPAAQVAPAAPPAPATQPAPVPAAHPVAQPAPALGAQPEAPPMGAQRVAQPAPQAVAAAPIAQAAPQPMPASQSTAPEATQRTRDAGDSTLDRPPRNLLPIYALIGVVVIAAIVVAIVLVTR